MWLPECWGDLLVPRSFMQGSEVGNGGHAKTLCPRSHEEFWVLFISHPRDLELA